MAARTVGECCLRWTDHNTLLQGLCTTLLTTEKFADVTLYCEGISLKCHKFILSACSAYFDQILSESPCEHPVIILKDVPYSQMQALLHFIYKGELTTDENNLTSLIELARSLHIKGIGDFGAATGGTSDLNPSKQKRKMKSSTTAHENQFKHMRDYLSTENMDSLSNRLLSLPQENQTLLGDTLSTPIDSSDFNLQEPEVEYSFESESLGDSQHISNQPILVEYTEETNINPIPPRNKRNVDSDAEISSDFSACNGPPTHVYKRYSEENLRAAIKAVVDDGVRQFDACNQFGIPFTTLTRKLRLYRSSDGHMLNHGSHRKKERPRSTNQVTLATVLSIERDQDGATNTGNSLSTENGVVLVIQNTMDNSSAEEEPKMLPSYKHYKTYSEDNLREAITAVLQNEMRVQEASNHYKIPLSTLSRKIRSTRSVVQSHLRPPSPACGTHSN